MTFTSLHSLISEYLSSEDQLRVKKAYDFANNAHKGQLRRSGNPYIHHPVQVACILAKLEQDSQTLSAALLHDVLEDCDCNYEDIKHHFGKDIAALVQGVTHLTSLRFVSKVQAQAENFRNMLIAMAKDVRVIIIKLADRLHNMRTLQYLNAEKQERIAKETLSVFAPLAHRFGLGSIKWELEDLAFSYLYPIEFNNIKQKLAANRDLRDDYISKLISFITPLFSHFSDKPIIKGRPKHLWGIFSKMQKHHLSFKDLYDVYGIRIRTGTIEQCYQILGIMHAHFTPISGRFKDYIALPKSNCYQSLHSSVIALDGQRVEIQIRTHQMHEVAEFGVASHWRYKEGKSLDLIRDDFSWLKQLDQLQKEQSSALMLIETLKDDFFPNEVFVFSPKGEVFSLKEGAVALDFAYHIHSDIGNACYGIKINGQMKPFGTILKNGDQLEVLTRSQTFPKKSWLNIVKTHHAKNKIQQWLKRQKKESLVLKGKELLNSWLANPKKSLLLSNKTEIETVLLKKTKHLSMEQLYLSIAYGEWKKKDILTIILEKTTLSPSEKLSKNQLPKIKSQTTKNLVIVKNYPSILTYLSTCCSPVYGDLIQGFIVKNKGISVHRDTCPNFIALNTKHPERVIAVTWVADIKTHSFKISLEISASDRMGLLQDILMMISHLKCNVLDVHASTIDKGKETSIKIDAEVHHQKQVKDILKHLTSMSEIYSVKRL